MGGVFDNIHSPIRMAATKNGDGSAPGASAVDLLPDGLVGKWGGHGLVPIDRALRTWLDAILRQEQPDHHVCARTYQTHPDTNPVHGYWRGNYRPAAKLLGECAHRHPYRPYLHPHLPCGQ